MFTSKTSHAEAGYMLLEALVAVAVAGLVLTTYIRTQMLARKAALLAPDILQASAATSSLINDLISGRSIPGQGLRNGLPYTVSLRFVDLVPTSSESDPALSELKPEPLQQGKVMVEVHQIDISLRGPHGHVLSRELVHVSPSLSE